MAENWHVDTALLEGFFKDKFEKIDLSAFYLEVAEAFYSKILRNFADEGKYFNNNWIALATSTIRMRSRTKVRVKDSSGNYVVLKAGKNKGKVKTRSIKPSWPGQILSVTGALKNRIEYKVENKKNIVFSFATDYAKYLHYGTKNMPARPLFPKQIPDDFLDDIAAAYWKQVSKLL